MISKILIEASNDDMLCISRVTLTETEVLFDQNTWDFDVVNSLADLLTELGHNVEIVDRGDEDSDIDY